MTRFIVAIAVVGAALIAGYWASGVQSDVKQPIEFPHKTHVNLGLPCTTCHVRAEKDAVAGRPPTELCLGCHAGGETDSAEIKKLRAFGEKGQEVPWRRVWRLPSHVYFPHRIHVAVAKVACQDCHGPMETLSRPPSSALKELSMNDCIACHEKRMSAKNDEGKAAQPVKAPVPNIAKDCLVCHR